MNAQDGVVGFDDCSRHLWARPNCERDFALLAVVHGQALQHQTAQAGSRAAAHGIVHTEALQAGAVVGQLANS